MGGLGLLYTCSDTLQNATKAALQSKTEAHSKAIAKSNLSKAVQKIRDYEGAGKNSDVLKQLEGEVQKAKEDATKYGEAVEPEICQCLSKNSTQLIQRLMLK